MKTLESIVEEALLEIKHLLFDDFSKDELPTLIGKYDALEDDFILYKISKRKEVK